MTDRWTLGYKKMEVAAPLRNDGIRRRSSGLRYFLLMPLAFFLFYGVLIWGAVFAASYLEDVRRFLRDSLARE